MSGAEPCEKQAVEQLQDLRNAAAEIAGRDGHISEDGQFYAEQNARLVVNAERYYRSMFRGGVESGNLRDLHMPETLEELTKHLERTTGTPAKVVVWAHNSHSGTPARFPRRTRSGSDGRPPERRRAGP
jgi:erythromycin esterase-like protein